MTTERTVTTSETQQFRSAEHPLWAWTRQHSGALVLGALLAGALLFFLPRTSSSVSPDVDTDDTPLFV